MAVKLTKAQKAAAAADAVAANKQAKTKQAKTKQQQTVVKAKKPQKAAVPPPLPPPIVLNKKPPVAVPKHLLLPTKIKRAPTYGKRGIGSYGDHLFGPYHSSLLSTYFPLLLLLSSALFWLWYFGRRFIRTKGRLPPGPIGRPLIGVGSQLLQPSSSLPISKFHSASGIAAQQQQQQPPFKVLSEWGKKFGPIYSFYNGPSQLVVVLNDYDTIRSAFVDQAEVFSGRPTSSVYKELSNNGYGIGVAEGDFWRDQQRFLHRSFLDLTGKSGNRFELLCIDEALALVEEFRQNISSPSASSSSFDPRNACETSAANILFALCYGRRLDREAPLLRKIINNTFNIAELSGVTGNALVEALPLLRHLQPYKQQHERFLAATALQRQLLAPEIARIREVYDESGAAAAGRDAVVESDKSAAAGVGVGTVEPVSLVEHFLHQRLKLKNPDASRLFCMDNILTNIQVIFIAGFEPLVASLIWCVMQLARQPVVQQKLYAEIVEKVMLNNAAAAADADNDTNVVTWADRTLLPNSLAFGQDVLRRTSIMPLGMPRRTTRDTKLGEFFIPKDTIVLANLNNAAQQQQQRSATALQQQQPAAAVSSVPPAFGTVDSSNNKEQLLTFGVGKRTCAGEPVVRMSTFIVMTNILAKLELSVPTTTTSAGISSSSSSSSKRVASAGGSAAVSKSSSAPASVMMHNLTLYPAPFEIAAKERDGESAGGGGKQHLSAVNSSGNFAAVAANGKTAAVASGTL